MKNDQTLIRAIRLAVSGAIGLSAAVVGQVASAQQSGEQMEEVTVTGSRIARPSDLEAISPVVSIDSGEITDPNGVASVTLQYQVVLSGQYIELADAAYTNAANWTSLPMTDNGAGGDLVAGDAVFSATIPSNVQAHRRLVRYRITVADTIGASVRVPYADDPQPNFAYFVYDGVPAWRGAAQPGGAGSNGVVFTVASNEMTRLPALHLIGRSNTIATATWFSRYGGDLYQWGGTLVYDGRVYDHIYYRARGGVTTPASSWPCTWFPPATPSECRSRPERPQP